MSVRRAQREVDSAEFSEWMAYARLEPFGQDRQDANAAAIQATLANVHRDPKSRPQPFTPDEFLLRFGDDEEPQEQPADVLATKLRRAR